MSNATTERCGCGSLPPVERGGRDPSLSSALAVASRQDSALKHEDRSNSMASTVLSSSSSQSSLQEEDVDSVDAASTSSRPFAKEPIHLLQTGERCRDARLGKDAKRGFHVAVPILLLSSLAVLSCFLAPLIFQDAISQNSIYVPGGGFSAFWFTVGRLQSMSETASKEFYCYSSGCIAAVAALGGYSKNEVIQMAATSQLRWKTGEVGLYGIAQDFVDRLVDSDRFDDSASTFQNIHIITARHQQGFFGGVQAEIRQASSLQELNEMLVQTTFIPFITGASLWRVDSRTSDYHIDGAFSFPSHPRCSFTLGFPWGVPHLYANVLNPNLSQEKAEILWDLGVDYGVHRGP